MGGFRSFFAFWLGGASSYARAYQPLPGPGLIVSEAVTASAIDGESLHGATSIEDESAR